MSSAREIYNDFKLNTSSTESKPFTVEVVGKDILYSVLLDSLSFQFNTDSKNFTEQLDIAILKLREGDLDYKYTYGDQTVYIKYHQGDKPLDPINPYEAQIQALLYLKGMMLIHDNLSEDENAKSIFKHRLHEIYALYLEEKDKVGSIKATEWLEDEFAKLLKTKFKIDLKSAHQQVVMARDLAIMLTPAKSICTISESDKQVSIELTTPTQIGSELEENQENYYHKEYSNPNSKWFLAAKKLAGFKGKANTWLDKFLTDSNQTNKLINAGVAAPPSARWLPTPANSQIVETHVASKNKEGKLEAGTTMSFVRTGTLTAFDMKTDMEEQLRIAKEQIKEIIRLNLKRAIANSERVYGKEATNLPIFISYQTLLSPHYFEASLYQGKVINISDNNAKFIEMTKQAMNEVEAEVVGKSTKVQIIFAHTNSAVNNKSAWVTAKTFDEDIEIRNLKLIRTAQTLRMFNRQLGIPDHQMFPIADMIEGLKPLIPGSREFMERTAQEIEKHNTELAKETAMRLRASFHLRELMNNQPPYNKFKAVTRDLFKKNIMMAALEYLALGNQSLSLVGCKSARDRTAIFAAAEKAMRQNPAAMTDWKALNDGIIRNLLEGHHFRAMMYHVAVVKISDVHSYFTTQLSKKLRHQIKSLKHFSKKIAVSTTTRLKELMFGGSIKEAKKQIQGELDKEHIEKALKANFIEQVMNNDLSAASGTKKLIEEIQSPIADLTKIARMVPNYLLPQKISFTDVNASYDRWVKVLSERASTREESVAPSEVQANNPEDNFRMH